MNDAQARPSYVYPDPGERLTLATIESSGLSMAQWQEQEAAILAAFGDQLTSLSPRLRLLDFGSGEGRLTLRFADLFEQVISVEPDVERAAAQAKVVAASGRHHVVELRFLDPQASAGQFDAALCSHVIQHVPTEAAAGVVAGLSRALRKGGQLLLLTNVTGVRSGRFVVSGFSPGGEVVEREVSRAEFDAASAHNELERLPIHFFAYDELAGLLGEHSLSVTRVYGFHGTAGLAGPLTPADDPGRAPGLATSRDIAIFATKD